MMPSTIKLGDAAITVDYGVTASAADSPVGPKFLRITDIQNGHVDWNAVPWCEADTKTVMGSRLESGDIVFARTGATTGKSFLIRECPHNSVFASYLIRLRLKDSFDPRFVSHFFQTPDYWAQITKSARGVAQPGVNATTLKSLDIPKLPLSEQKRIASILDRAEALRAKRRAALALLDELTQSIFLDMFGDAEVHGSEWPVRKIADYVAEFQGGKSLESNDDNGSERRVLKVSAVTGMKFRPHESKPIDDDYKPSDEHYVKNGDLLFSRANTTELVGAVAYVSNCPQNLLLPDKLWRFVWKDKKTVHPLFIWYLFQTRPVRREIGNRATGTSGSMKNISKAKLFGIPTIFPPFELQQTFANRITEIEHMQDCLKKSLSELDQLFASLQHQAFRGEL